MKDYITCLEKRESVQELCNRYSLNPNILKPLFELSMQGYNNKEISEKIGVHRITIQRYVSTLKKLREHEFQKIYHYILIGDYDEKGNKN